VLRGAIDSPTVTTDRFGEVAALDATCTWDEDSGELTILAVNRSGADGLELTVPLDGFGGTEGPGADPAEGTPAGAFELVEALVLHEDDPYAVNTVEEPDRVLPRPLEEVHLAARSLTAALPPISWAMIRLRRRP
jgi:alpha-N-arabinofuranosidase